MPSRSATSAASAARVSDVSAAARSSASNGSSTYCTRSPISRSGSAGAKPWEVLADRGHDRAHPVVRARSALLAEPDLAKRQVHLIEHDEQVGGLDPVTIEQLAYGTAGVVHERLRPRDRDAHTVDRTFGDARVGRLERELSPRALREPGRDLEADVVARRGVALAGIPESHDDAVDARGRFSASEESRESCQLRSQTPKGPVRSDGAADASLFQVNDSVRDLARGALVDWVQDEDRLVGPGLGHLTEVRREILRRHRRDVVRPLGCAIAHPDEHARAMDELGRVPTGAHARGVDVPAEIRKTIDGVPVGAEPGVPRANMRQGNSEHARAVRAEHERDASARRRQQDRVLDAVELTLERDVLASEEPSHDLERFLES